MTRKLSNSSNSPHLSNFDNDGTIILGNGNKVTLVHRVATLSVSFIVGGSILYGVIQVVQSQQVQHPIQPTLAPVVIQQPAMKQLPPQPAPAKAPNNSVLNLITQKVCVYTDKGKNELDVSPSSQVWQAAK